jgi:hypothetical protein
MGRRMAVFVWSEERMARERTRSTLRSAICTAAGAANPVFTAAKDWKEMRGENGPSDSSSWMWLAKWVDLASQGGAGEDDGLAFSVWCRRTSGLTAAQIGKIEENNGGATGARIVTDAGHLGALPLGYSESLPKPELNRQPPRYERSSTVLTASRLKSISRRKSARGCAPVKVEAAGVEPPLCRSTSCLAAGKNGEPVGTCTLLSRLKGGGFAIKASGSKRWSRLDLNQHWRRSRRRASSSWATRPLL